MGLRWDSLVVLAVCGCVLAVSVKNVDASARAKRTTTPDNSCENVRQFFRARNTTLPAAKDKGSVCGGECCNDDTEDLLRKQGQKDFAGLLKHVSRTTQGLLSFTAATLQNHVSDLSHQSENKTLLLFTQVYQGMAVLSKDLIRSLYSDIRKYILVNSTKTNNTDVDIRASVSTFFSNFFPLVYYNILHIKNSKDFAPDYKECLRKTTENILPFGDIPKQLADSLSKSLEATRLLLQAFATGAEVLNTTDRLLADDNVRTNSECHRALLKMTHCPKCLGLGKHTKPCTGYCLNVVRGCLTKYVAELDSPWNGYVEGVESLINSMKKNRDDAGVDVGIKSLDGRISDAIMKTMQTMKEIDIKVQRICGKPTFTTRTDPLWLETSTPLPLSTKPRSASQRLSGSSADTHLLHFVTSISKTRGFYSNLADTICNDDSFAEPKDERCWNGERIAEYTKTVVDVGLGMQKYNPEVQPTTNLQNVDPRVAVLVDKLRHVHHMAMSSVGSSGVDVDYMQRDGFEGSGSGNGPDEEDDEYNPAGSGSGHGAIHEGDTSRETPLHTAKETHAPEGKKPSATPTGQAPAADRQTAILLSLVFLVLSRL